MSVTNRRKTMKRWSFPVAVEAPCGECDKKPCGAYNDKCYAYKEFKAKMEELKEKKIADKVIREGATRRWTNVKANGLKIRKG